MNRKAMLSMIKPMTFTLTMDAEQILDIVEEAAYTVFDEFSEEAIKLGGTTYDQLLLDLATDEKVRKLVLEQANYRLEDALESVNICDDDLDGTEVATKMVAAFRSMDDIIQEVNVEDKELQAAMALLAKNGYTCAKV